MKTTLKTLTVLFSCALLLGIAAAAFWYQDWQYSRPTPRPAALVQPAVGSVPLALAALETGPGGRPLFLHFFNPGCPCSRFNLDHVRDLTAKYRGRVRFVAVVPGGDANSLGLPMETVADKDGAIARACGVYSTPQAVLLDSAGRLYYRGNYNSSRYCTASGSQYARIALESLLAGSPPPHLPPAATIAYGCPLPSSIESRSRPL